MKRKLAIKAGVVILPCVFIMYIFLNTQWRPGAHSNAPVQDNSEISRAIGDEWMISERDMAEAVLSLLYRKYPDTAKLTADDLRSVGAICPAAQEPVCRYRRTIKLQLGGLPKGSPAHSEQQVVIDVDIDARSYPPRVVARRQHSNLN